MSFRIEIENRIFQNNFQQSFTHGNICKIICYEQEQ